MVHLIVKGLSRQKVRAQDAQDSQSPRRLHFIFLILPSYDTSLVLSDAQPSHQYRAVQFRFALQSILFPFLSSQPPMF
jgi:hypothetical protein